MKKLKNCAFFSICLDESTDATNISQLTIFCRMVNKDFTVDEVFLKLHSFHQNTKALDVYKAVESALKHFNKDKCVSVCTNGAAAMVKKSNGLIGLMLKMDSESYQFIVLSTKPPSAKILKVEGVMEIITKVVNKIKGGHNSLNHRKFKTF